MSNALTPEDLEAIKKASNHPCRFKEPERQAIHAVAEAFPADEIGRARLRALETISNFLNRTTKAIGTVVLVAIVAFLFCVFGGLLFAFSAGHINIFHFAR